MYRIAVISDRALPEVLTDGSVTVAAWCFAGMPEAPRVNSDAAPAYASVDELLAAGHNLDLVLLQTRTGYHAEYAIKALQAGFPVLCNGPLCLTGSAAWQILETARYTRRQVQVQQGALRFWKHARAALGDITGFSVTARSTDAGGSRFPDGGQLYTVFYPLLEALSVLLGPIETVTGQLVETGGDDLESGGVARIVLAAGGAGELYWNVADPGAPEGFTIQVEGATGSVRVTGSFDGDRLLPGSVEASGATIPDPGAEPDPDVLLRNALRGGPVPEWEPFPALRTVEWIDRIYSRLRRSPE